MAGIVTPDQIVAKCSEIASNTIKVAPLLSNEEISAYDRGALEQRNLIRDRLAKIAADPAEIARYFS